MQETVAAGAPSSSPIKKPSGSAAAKQASSAKPGFQPSSAAQFTAIEISSGRIGRMRKPFMAGDRTNGLTNRYHSGCRDVSTTKAGRPKLALQEAPDIDQKLEIRLSNGPIVRLRGLA